MSRQKQSPVNVVFIAFGAVGILVGAVRAERKGGTDSSLQGAKDGVALGLGLVGVIGGGGSDEGKPEQQSLRRS